MNSVMFLIQSLLEIPVGMLGLSYRFACLYMFRNQHLSWLTMIEYAFLPSEKSC